MEPHPLTTFTAKLVEEHGVPQVLDVEHSVQVHKPILTGSNSPADYYIRPPEGMSADALIEWFESIPTFREFKLTLVPILGLDTYHQPLISADDFAKKYFHDNQLRVIRVTGKSNQAIEAMVTFVQALKRPFDANLFPHHQDFAVSGYRAPEEGRATEVKLLFRPADHTQLMRVERLVSIHLDECNLGREISASRHATRSQAPELILISPTNAPAGVAFLEALNSSLPRANPQEIAEATEIAHQASGRTVTEAPSHQTRFTQPQAPVRNLSPEQLKKNVISCLADFMTNGKFAGGLQVNIVQAGTSIEVTFPRTASSLWLSTSFREAEHIKELSRACVGVRTDPVLRDGWSAAYNFDSKTGKLHIRAVETGSEPPGGWKLVPK